MFCITEDVAAIIFTVPLPCPAVPVCDQTILFIILNLTVPNIGSNIPHTANLSLLLPLLSLRGVLLSLILPLLSLTVL